MATLAQLDRRDRAILAQLDRDCRQSNADIARRLRLGKHVVSYRIAQLEKAGVISKYYTLIDMSKVGRQSYRLYLKFLPLREEERRAVFDYLVKSPATWFVGEMDGEWDAGFVLWTRDHYEFERFWSGFAEKFQKCVEKSNLSVYLRDHFYTLGFLGTDSEARQEYVIGRGGSADVDEKDRRILDAVAENARRGTMEIAKRTSLTPVQVAYRLKKLVKEGVISAFRASISLEGLTVYKVNFHLSSMEKKQEMLEFAKGEKWTVYVDESVGMADFEWDLVCPSYTELKDSVERFKRTFFKHIRKYDFQIYGRFLKERFF
ncbi:HTH-type transcriptional regulator Ptr2 [uncultured archaeon]|nr:HTH-type transcriptional regulator Ptr2 [uncultured archaeon]